MQYAAFKDSAVTRMGRQRLLEEASCLPSDLFPVYVGNGHIGMNLDASGLQSLDTRRLDAWWGCGPDANYVFRHGFLSSHLAWKTHDFQFNLMPTGYLDWILQYGDVVVDSATLKDRAHVWRRTVDIAGSRVETSMLIGVDLRLTVAIFIPFGSTKIVLRFDVKAYDQRNQPIAAPRPFTLTARMNLCLRNGAPIFDSVRPEGDSVCVEHNGYEPYAMRYRWHHDKPVAVHNDASAYAIEWKDETANAPAILNCCIDVDAPEAAEPFSCDGIETRHRNDWDAFWSNAGSVSTGDVRRDFLYANSIHFLRCGHEYSKGGLGGSLASHTECWMGCNFWDMMWVCDGLLRSNNAALAVDFVRWLKKVMRPEGRPFPWMMTYDGRTPVKPEEDHGLVVIDAFATIAIRTYLETQDESLFRECVWPICSSVCSFLVAEIYSAEDDHYIIGKPLGHDVGGMAEALVNDTYTNVWSTSVLRRSLLLAREHGLQPEWAETAERIVATTLVESDDRCYHHARGLQVKDFSFASWVPNLAYPTEMLDMLDAEKYAATREAFPFVSLYMQKQGDYQPWSYFWTALCDVRRGAPNEAERHIQEGVQFTHAAGYFCECGPWQWGSCGLPPYPAPHGAYLVAVSEQFFAGSYWDDTLRLCTNFPDDWKSRSVECANIRSGNGCVLQSLRYTPATLDAVISGTGRHRIVCLVPPGVTGAAAAVRVDGAPCDSAYDEEKRTATFTIALGDRPCSIAIGG